MCVSHFEINKPLELEKEILFNRVNLLSKIVIKKECIFPIKNNKEWLKLKAIVPIPKIKIVKTNGITIILLKRNKLGNSWK